MKLPTASALAAEIFLKKGIHQEDNNRVINSVAQSYELSGYADISKKPQSAIAWENQIYDLFPLWLHTILNNAQMKLTTKCICIFIKHSYPLEMFTKCFGNELIFHCCSCMHAFQI